MLTKYASELPKFGELSFIKMKYDECKERGVVGVGNKLQQNKKNNNN